MGSDFSQLTLEVSYSVLFANCSRGGIQHLWQVIRGFWHQHPLTKTVLFSKNAKTFYRICSLAENTLRRSITNFVSDTLWQFVKKLPEGYQYLRKLSFPSKAQNFCNT
jgi:hypothetical protein